jgi:hypothetical protein
MSKSYADAQLRAMASGYSLTHGRADDAAGRDLWPVDSRSRRRCPCCKKRATHVGGSGGVGLMSGCELRVRRWVRDGYTSTT